MPSPEFTLPGAGMYTSRNILQYQYRVQRNGYCTVQGTRHDMYSTRYLVVVLDVLYQYLYFVLDVPHSSRSNGTVPYYQSCTGTSTSGSSPGRSFESWRGVRKQLVLLGREGKV